MSVQLTDQLIDPWQSLASAEKAIDGMHGNCGARAVFIGSMRDFNEGDRIQAMELEHYPEMTRRYLENLVSVANQRWHLIDSLIIHRYGPIKVDDSIVVVAAWSGHRAEAFAACRFLIEELKHKAPFWKKEQLQSGERWVETNTPAGPV